MRPAAFTLIEVMAVVALLGLLAGATAWSLAQDAQRASREQMLKRIAHVDHSARLAARRIGRAYALHIDIDQQRLCRVEQDDEGREEPSHRLNLAPGFRIDRVITAASATSISTADFEAGIATIESGTLAIPYSSAGHCISYALRFTSTKDDSHIWLVFAGLSGQATVIHNEADIHNLFTVLTTGRPDPD